MRYFIIAGEASGDLHASNLMRELKSKDTHAEFCFLGGDLMQAQGGRIIKHYREMAFMGIWAVVKNAGKVLNNLQTTKQAILDFRPDVLILVDYPSFNLRIARFVKEKMNLPVYYYISPKLWAWKEYRIKAIKRYVDKMYTIFPFETEFYAKHHFKVSYVGNPSVDSVYMYPYKYESFESFCKANQLEQKPVIAILSGSRKQEIVACLPKMIESCQEFSDYQPVIGGAPGIEPEFYTSILGSLMVKVVYDQTYDLLQNATAAIVNSGTATLETALIGTPEVVVYHVLFPWLASLVKKVMIKVPYVSLVNLILGKEAVKELVAYDFRVNNVKSELRKILEDQSYRAAQEEDLIKLKKLLGDPGTAMHAAERIIVDLSEIK